MRRIGFFFELLKVSFLRYRRNVFLGIGLGLLAFVFILTNKNFFSPKPRIIGLSGNYRTTDLPREVLEKISIGLTMLDKNLEPQPAAASSFIIRSDGKTFIFELKNNLVWQDGKPFVAADVDYPLANVEIETIGENHVQFNLEESFAPLPVVVSAPMTRPGLIGLGDYRVEKISLEGAFIKWIKLASDSGEDVLIYKFYPNEEMLSWAFKLGEVEEILGLSSRQAFADFKNVEIEDQGKGERIVTAFFNTKEPPFSSKAARLALAYAASDGFPFERARGPLDPRSWAFHPNLKEYHQDPELAKRLWQESKVEEKKITMVTKKEFLPLAEVLARQWEELGIEVLVQEVFFIPEDFDIYLGVFNPGFDPDQYVFWHSTQKEFNLSRFSNPKIDKLLEDGRLINDKKERREIYLEFQKELVEQAPALFLYYLPEYRVYRK